MVEVVLLAIGAVAAPFLGAVEAAQVRLAFSVRQHLMEVQSTRATRKRELSPSCAPLLFILAGTCRHSTLLIALISMDLQQSAIFKNNLKFCF